MRIVFKHLPLAIHKDAPAAHLASVVAAKQGKFWEYHDKLFQNTKNLKLPTFKQYAQELGMDVAQFVGDRFEAAAWTTVELPALVEKLGYDVDGMMWFRRTIQIPEAWAGRDLTLSLGAIDDNDITWFNGVQVGATNNWQAKRVYTVPGSAVRAGEAVLAVRVEDTGGAG